MTSSFIYEEQVRANVARFGSPDFPGGVCGDWSQYAHTVPVEPVKFVPKPPRPADWYDNVRASVLAELGESDPGDSPDPASEPGNTDYDPMFDEAFFQ